MVPAIIRAVAALLVVRVVAPHTLFMSVARLAAAMPTPLQSLASMYISALLSAFRRKSPDVKSTKRSAAFIFVANANNDSKIVARLMCFMFIDFPAKISICV